MGQPEQAQRLLLDIYDEDWFIDNSIFQYCANHFRSKQTQESSDVDYLDLADQCVDILTLFQGMIHQHQLGNHIQAILIYHRCIFFAAHTVLYSQLGICYAEIGLYDRAQRFSKIAYQNSIGQYSAKELIKIKDKMDSLVRN